MLPTYLVCSKPVPRSSIVVKTSLLLSRGSVQHKHLRSSKGLCHSILALVSNADWAKCSLKTHESILLQRFSLKFVYCLDRIVHEIQVAVSIVMFPLSPGSALHRIAGLGFETSCIQGGSNMTGTDLCVNKPHCAAAVRP